MSFYALLILHFTKHSVPCPHFMKKHAKNTCPYLSVIKGEPLAAKKDLSQSPKINFNFLDSPGSELSGSFNQPCANNDT